MKEPYPTKEVLLITRHFIRDVAAKNQQYIMTNEGEYWDAIRSRYGGKSASAERPELEHLYDFNWYVFHELKKYRQATVSNSEQFFRDYLGVVEEFCKVVPTEYVTQYFFEAYYVNWLVAATYQRQNLPRIQPVLKTSIKDLPKGMQSIEGALDTLSTLLVDTRKNWKAILDVLSAANSDYLKSEGLYLTGNFVTGRKDAVLVNAFRIVEEFKYPITFSHQYGDAYLRICREIAKTIGSDKNQNRKYKTFAKQEGHPNIKILRKNLDNFESLRYHERINIALLPLIGYLITVEVAAQDRMFKAIYSRNTTMPIPEPVEYVAK
ncbi:MAG: hypothetical protein GF401_03250 [Chitinivibrionales bacterium]|nr:hypothetical protein [Chitinivibrionales bacterium]